MISFLSTLLFAWTVIVLLFNLPISIAFCTHHHHQQQQQQQQHTSTVVSHQCKEHHSRIESCTESSSSPLSPSQDHNTIIMDSSTKICSTAAADTSTTATATATGITDTPNRRVLFENDRVRVNDIRLSQGESIEVVMTYPTVRWQVDDGIITTTTTSATTTNDDDDDNNNMEEETISEIFIPDKHVTFQMPGETCKLWNALPAPKQQQQQQNDNIDNNTTNKITTPTVFRQIWFEMKQSSPRRSEEKTQQILNNAIYSTNVGTTLLFENQYCRVWDFYLEPGEGDPTMIHHHVLDYVFVYVAKGRLLGSTPHDGKLGLFDSINEDGDVTFFDIPDGAESNINYAHGGKNGYDDLPMREYLVELK